MMDTTQVGQVVQLSPWAAFALEVAKLLVLMIFTTAALDVLKTAYKRYNPAGMNEYTIGLWKYAIAFFTCYSFGYGAMSHIIEFGSKARASADMVDYVLTAAVIFMGADWFFQQFSASVEKAKAAKEIARAKS
jgi:hypothetical protein